MITIRTQTHDGGFEILKSLVIGKSVKYIELLTGNRYTKNHESIDGIRLFFEDGTRLEITQDFSLFDGEHNNPLEIELYTEAK